MATNGKGPTREQVNYACRRVDEIVHTKHKAVAKKHTTVRPSGAVTVNELVALIKRGKVKPHDGTMKIGYDGQHHWGHFPNINSVFDLEAVCPSPQDLVDDAKVKTEMRPVYAQAASIKDQIVLGDLEQAISLIDAFAKS